MNIAEIDSNFKLPDNVKRDNLFWHDVRTAPGTHGKDRKIRRDYIESVWRDAVAESDENVWFVDGYTIFAGDLEDECTVEWCHPNDLGMRKMAPALTPIFKKIYGIK